MLNWYRALLRRPAWLSISRPITVPTLLLWGANDRFLGLEMARASLEQCQQGQLVVFEEATHWVHHEHPARVNALLETFLRAGQIG